MERPQLLLVPEFTELEWVIAPQLAEWAEVATYDPPGVGREPIEDEEIEAVRAIALGHACSQARVVRVPETPGTSEGFAKELREFCGEIQAVEAAHRQRP